MAMTRVKSQMNSDEPESQYQLFVGVDISAASAIVA